MKWQITLAYMAMDIECPRITEDPTEIKQYKQTQKFQVRHVNTEKLKLWISKFCGQATYVCQQLWLTQKLQSVFAGAFEKAKQVD